MNSLEIDAHARAFFDEFVEAFPSFDGATIAQRYLAPYLAFHSAGNAQVFASTRDIGHYFQEILDNYHAKGCRTCRYVDLSVTPLGKDCAVGTVTWQLLADDQSVVSGWRESYNLCLVDGRFKVFASTDHAA